MLNGFKDVRSPKLIMAMLWGSQLSLTGCFIALGCFPTDLWCHYQGHKSRKLHSAMAASPKTPQSPEQGARGSGVLTVGQWGWIYVPLMSLVDILVGLCHGFGIGIEMGCDICGKSNFSFIVEYETRMPCHLYCLCGLICAGLINSNWQVYGTCRIYLA